MTRTIQGDLRTIPGIGKSLETDLQDLGHRMVRDLDGEDPEAMYEALCDLRGQRIGCCLYVFRCAVYFSSRTTHDAKLLKWWNWKDRA